MLSIPKTPPMGWNSWDCFGAAVNEEQVRANADYMAKNLKEYGWEYIVVDIQWYEPEAVSHTYNDDAELIMDEYGRLMPAENRFPSARNGAGFKPLADYIHSLGLKFGIHILRGIPKQAIRRNVPVKGTNVTAAEIVAFGSTCDWNGDMCGIDLSRLGAQSYYDSIFELYASWGVDFVKVDDIARPYHREEIEAVSAAIEKCGREIVLSLSPGAAPVTEHEHLAKHANMWRMTDDFWDDWAQLYKMFDYCRDWFPYVKDGHYPDCDMLPLGRLRLCDAPEGCATHFTKDEQRTLMSLWSIFRSPLMFGGHMPMNDEFTLSLIQNRDLIEINQSSRAGREVMRRENEIIWAANGIPGTYYCAVFNTGTETQRTVVDIAYLGISGTADTHEIWTGDNATDITAVSALVPPHSVRLYKIIVK